jgi:hypothetical protein
MRKQNSSNVSGPARKHGKASRKSSVQAPIKIITPKFEAYDEHTSSSDELVTLIKKTLVRDILRLSAVRYGVDDALFFRSQICAGTRPLPSQKVADKLWRQERRLRLEIDRVLHGLACLLPMLTALEVGPVTQD